MVWPTADIPTYGRGVWLECNGQSFDRNRFPQLYETLGTTRVPDYQGMFLRGYGSQSHTSWRNTKVNEKSITYSSDEIGEIQNDAEIFWNTEMIPATLYAWGHAWSFIDLSSKYPQLFPAGAGPDGIVRRIYGFDAGGGVGAIFGQAGTIVSNFPNTNFHEDIFLPQHPKHITYEPVKETVSLGEEGPSITVVTDIVEKHEKDFESPDEGVYYPSSEGVGWYHAMFTNIGMMPTSDEVRPVNTAVKFMIKAK